MQPPSNGSSTADPHLVGRQEEHGNSPRDEETHHDRGAVNGSELASDVAAPMLRQRTDDKKVVFRGNHQTPGNACSTSSTASANGSGNNDAIGNDDHAAGNSQKSDDKGAEVANVAATTAGPTDLTDGVESRQQKVPVSITSESGRIEVGAGSAAIVRAVGKKYALKKGGPAGTRGRARGGTSTRRKTAVVKKRSRARATTSSNVSRARAKAPVPLRTEDDIQGMVDKIKSRNPNNGGGRQAKGGPWMRKNPAR